MNFTYPDEYSAGYQADAAAKNGANPYRFKVGSLALPNPRSHLHPLQMNKMQPNSEAVHYEKA